jgi:hypothetical protein
MRGSYFLKRTGLGFVLYGCRCAGGESAEYRIRHSDPLTRLIIYDAIRSDTPQTRITQIPLTSESHNYATTITTTQHAPHSTT